MAKKKTLDELLEDWSVMEPGLWDNDAFAFRLDKINTILNK